MKELSDQDMAVLSVTENIQREDLNPIEAAEAFARLATDAHLTHEQIAARTGKDRATVTNFLRLLKLPDDVIADFETWVKMGAPDPRDSDAKIVKKEIENNRFVVATNQPNVRVSWQVTAVRKDPYARAHPLVVEQPKTGSDLGRYLFPQGYGVRRSLGVLVPKPVNVASARRSAPISSMATRQEMRPARRE